MVEAVSKTCLRTCAAPATATVLALLALIAVRPGFAETLSDPTRPALPVAQAPVADGVTTPQVGVGMVVTAKEGVMALIGGRILRVGSRTDNGVVVQIVPDAVFVRAADGKVSRLSLYPEVSVQAVGTPQTGVVADSTRRAAGSAGNSDEHMNKRHHKQEEQRKQQQKQKQDRQDRSANK